jgi:hypothetical protein
LVNRFPRRTVALPDGITRLASYVLLVDHHLKQPTFMFWTTILIALSIIMNSMARHVLRVNKELKDNISRLLNKAPMALEIRKNFILIV